MGLLGLPPKDAFMILNWLPPSIVQRIHELFPDGTDRIIVKKSCEVFLHCHELMSRHSLFSHALIQKSELMLCSFRSGIRHICNTGESNLAGLGDEAGETVEDKLWWGRPKCLSTDLHTERSALPLHLPPA